MSNGAAPGGAPGITSVDPGIAARFGAWLDQNPDQVALAPSDPNKVDQSTSKPDENAAASEQALADEATRNRQAQAEQEERARVQEAGGEEQTDTEDGAQADAATDETAAEEHQPEGDEDITTVAQLADLFDVAADEDPVTADSLLELTVPGREEDSEVTLREVVDFYHNGPGEEAHVAAQIEAGRAELATEHQEGMAELERSIAGMIAHATAEFNGVDWGSLREDNLERYVELTERRDRARHVIEDAINTYDGRKAKGVAEAKQRDEGWKASQTTALHRLHPEWKDPAAWQAVKAEIDDYLVSKRIPKDIRDSLFGAGQIDIVWEGLQYRKIQNTKPTIRNLRRILPRTMRRSARAADNAPIVANQKEHAAKVSAHGEHGTVDTAAKLFEEHL